MKQVKLNDEDVEKIKAMGKTPAQFVHEMLGNPKPELGNPKVTLGKPEGIPKILHAEKIVLGPPMTGLTQADVEKLILKERERTREIVTRIVDKHFDSPLSSASLPEGTQDWLVPVKPEDMNAVAKDMMKKMKEQE